jgi:hypothetical protein
MGDRLTASAAAPVQVRNTAHSPEPTHAATGTERDVRPDGEFYCLACSSRLTGCSCKIRCPRCGYFEDCSNLL